METRILQGYSKPVTLATLANGFTIIHIPSKKKVSRVSLSVATGSLDDGDRIGAAHFLEHLIEGGTHRGGMNPRIAEFAFRHGLMQNNALTSKEFTEYFGSTFAEQSIAYAKLLLKEVFHPEIHERAVELEIGVIRSEVLRQNETRALHERVMGLLMPSYPEIHHTPAGRVETVESMTAEALSSHHRSHYTASRSLLCYAGSTPVEQLLSELAPLAEQIPPGSGMPERRTVYVPEQPGEHVIASQNIQSREIEIHMPGVPIGDDRMRYTMYTQFLTNYKHGLLYKELRHKRRLAYTMNMAHHAWPLCTSMIEVDGLGSDNVKEARSALIDTMDSVTEATFTPELLNHFRNERLLHKADDTKKANLDSLVSKWLVGMLDWVEEDVEVLVTRLTATDLMQIHQRTWGVGNRLILELQPSA